MSDDLLAAARAVRENAHAPYSNFKVGGELGTKISDLLPGAFNAGHVG